MTRGEAIHRLKNTAWLGSNDDRVTTEEAVEMAIEALQTEVVRCKDCRWFDKGENVVDSWEYCTRLGHHPQSDGFCAWGERRG